MTLPADSTDTSTAAATQTIYVTLVVDPTNAVNESTTSDKAGRGVGLDTSPVTSSRSRCRPTSRGPRSRSRRSTTSKAGVYSWGDTFDITEQIKNVGQGDAPATRARIVLTPAGATPGGYSDVTIGDIAVPAIPAFQSTNVVQRVTLPADRAVATLNSASQFTVSVVQDADFLTQPIYPRIADQGTGTRPGAARDLARSATPPRRRG